MPKLQLLLLLLIQITEPITAEVIYPFIIGAVRNTGITHGDEKKTGYYAGVIVNVFSWAITPYSRLVPGINILPF